MKYLLKAARGKRDISKLTPVIITDKNGHRRKVYIRADKKETKTSKNYIAPETAKAILDGIVPIPKGWYVHGRRADKKFLQTEYPAQFTRDINVAKQYANNNEIWMVKEKVGANVLDFRTPYNKDVIKFATNIYNKINSDEIISQEQKEHLDEFISGIDPASKEDVLERVQSIFCPKDIVSTAEAYDDWHHLALLELATGDWPDFIKTPDGAVAMPGSLDNLETIELIRASNGEGKL